MKGPGLKVRNDVRRLWRCPTSGKELRVAGDVTAVRSPFVTEPTWMELVEVFRPPRKMVPVEDFHHLEEVAADAVFETDAKPTKSDTQKSDEPTTDESKPTSETADADVNDVRPEEVKAKPRRPNRKKNRGKKSKDDRTKEPTADTSSDEFGSGIDEKQTSEKQAAGEQSSEQKPAAPQAEADSKPSSSSSDAEP